MIQNLDVERDPDCHQNQTDSYLSHTSLLLKISSESVHIFLDPEGRSQKATLVVVVISSLRVQKPPRLS